jgi:hypothetical protein
MHDKKLAILALTALFSVPSAALPPVIKAGANQILTTIINLCGELEKQKALDEAAEKEDEEEIDEDDVSDDDFELDEEEDKFKDEPDLIERAKAAAEYYEDERDDSDDDSEDESEIDSDGDTSYAIDDIDEVIFFVEFLKGTHYYGNFLSFRSFNKGCCYVPSHHRILESRIARRSQQSGSISRKKKSRKRTEETTRAKKIM